MNICFRIALRYLIGRTKERFISLISIISIVGVATGVATLIIVIGVMTGFDLELRDRIIGTSSHIVVDKVGGMDDADVVVEKVRAIEGVVGATPFINSQALLSANDRLQSVIIRGIDPRREQEVTSLRSFIKKGELSLDEGNAIIIGTILAQRLFLGVGDTVSLISASDVEGQDFTVKGIFSSDMYDYDMGVVFISLASAAAFTDDPLLVSGLSVKINDVYKAEKIKNDIQNSLGFPYYTRTWMDMNRNLFNALKLEKTAMFVILTLIVMVAALNIASTLIMMVMDKTKDIGILKAIGATAANIRIVFMLVGMFIGVIGTLLGTAGGLALAYVLKTYDLISLPEDVYYMSRLPMSVNVVDVLMIVGAALGISLAATFYPAFHASRLSPVEAVRYE